MRTKKQRIISFLMAFLLIFTFAFITPLTISQSYAAFPAIALTANGMRIIAGVLVSAGVGITAGEALQQVDYESAIKNLSSVIYKTMNGAQKLLLMSLSIIDNIVDVPVSLYNHIIDSYEKVISPVESSSFPSNYNVKYFKKKSTNISYPDIVFPFYEGKSFVTDTDKVYTSRKIDLRECQPFFIYKGVDNVTENTWYEDGIDYVFINDFPDDTPLYNQGEGIILTPDLESYNITYSSYKTRGLSLSETDTQFRFYENVYNSSYTRYETNSMIKLPKEGFVLNNYNIYSYFVEASTGYIFTVTDIYDKETGEFLQQIWTKYFVTNSTPTYPIANRINSSKITNPLDYDITFEPQATITPPVTNTAGDNVLTLPSELSGNIGATSTDVNVGTTDVPDTPNTDTMENINTNVGDLVTGGELGEQVNMNIGTVEGLHGEITEQVDFGSVFDTIAQYISALDISSVTWFPAAVSSFLIPFLPVISLGMILFFIDRVLNGGA